MNKNRVFSVERALFALFVGLSFSACQVEIKPHPVLDEIVEVLDEKLSAGSEEIASGSGAEEVTPPVAFTVFKLDEFEVNLRGARGHSMRRLRMTLSLEVQAALVETLHARNDELRAAVLLIASDYSYTELEGMEGKSRLRDDVHVRLNRVLAPNLVERVYFTEFMVDWPLDEGMRQ